MRQFVQRRNRRVTLKDVAQRAGVLVMTVSNVINNWPRVAEGTREKVQLAIDELGYRPNTVARSLVTGRSHTVGVVISDLTNPFFGQVVRGSEDVLYEAGYNILLCNTNEDSRREQAYLEMLVGRGVDGLLMLGSGMTYQEILAIVPSNLPIVTENPPIQKGNVIVIQLDNAGGAYTATRHLIGLGHRRIGHIAGPLARPAGRLRVDGYQKALSEAGLPAEPELIVPGHPSMRGGYNAARQLLQTQHPSALFCFNDLMAFGAMAACSHLSIDIPGDLALVGFDDVPMAVFVDPALTSIRIDQYQLGWQAGELLLGRLSSGEDTWSEVEVPSQLVVRNSCGAQRLSRQQLQEMMERQAVSDGADLYASRSGAKTFQP
jgi:DNA-binding LacI/PurR family transcriptional regulator